MTELALAGCRVTPLGSYLQALGVLRAVTRCLDPEATGCWRDRQFVLGSALASTDELVDELGSRFEPEAVVSPWNAGSGFVKRSGNVEAAANLQAVRESDDPRLARLRNAVAVADKIVLVAQERGWGGRKGELWDPLHKADVLRLCRGRLPDRALGWLDAAAALGFENDVAFGRILGTGGNLGRQDLSAGYVAHALTTLDESQSEAWLRGLVSGDESIKLARGSAGQYDPGRVGGPEDAGALVNPWAFLLTIEGALLFAGAVVRRLGAQFARPALPFQVRGTTAGFDSAAGGEGVLGEIWVPEWPQPATLAEVSHLLAEGRAEWRDEPARTGLDFARAVANLGVDRGISAFGRHVFVDRLGQNPLAVPAGRVQVTKRGEVGLLAEIDPWLARLRGDTMPASIATGVRRVEQSLFRLAADGGGERFVDVFISVGRLHEAVGRSSTARSGGQPLTLPRGEALLGALTGPGGPADTDADLRVALALATAQDRPGPALADGVRSLRPLLQPVGFERGVLCWTAGPALAPLAGGIAPALAEAARRRAFPGAVPETVPDLDLGVQGVRIAFSRGLALGTADRLAFLTGSLDDARLADLLGGLLCVRWPGRDDASLRDGPAEPPRPALDLLLLFTAADAKPLPVRPGAWWPAALAAGHVTDVLADARRRVRLAGQRFVIDSRPPSVSGQRLASALLLRSTPASRTDALRRVARNDDEEKTA